MLLIYGGNGWIGNKIVSILEAMKTHFIVSNIRADDIKSVEEEIKSRKPTNIMCLLGRTHGTFEGEYIPTIDYLEKKGKVKENVRDNLFCPIALALLCKKYDIHLTYLGTGCIFTYTDGKRIFTEEDEPNFFGSSYSVVKGYTDRLMHMFDNVLNVRIRMPISSDNSPRNFIVKLLKYEKICSMQNSMTVLDELLPIMCDMAINREIGTVNLTNPGTIEHSEILDMYKEIVDPTFTYNLFSYEDQMKVIACDRSNNELDTTALSGKYGIKNIKQSVRDILNKIKSKIFIVGGVNGGGSLKFIQDFKSFFPSKSITCLKELKSIKFNADDILFIQHFFESDLTYKSICKTYLQYKCRIIISIHDFYYFSLEYGNGPHNGYLKNSIYINPDVRQLFSYAEAVIHPSEFTYDIFKKYLPKNNFIISPHIDFKTLNTELYLPLITDMIINIGHLTYASQYKGYEYVGFLMKKFEVYKGYTVRFHIPGVTIPEYHEKDFFDIVNKYNIHCQLALNKWGETYCYALSKYLMTGLPILYNNIGAFTSRITQKDHYINVFTNEIQFDNKDKELLSKKFSDMLDYIIANQGTGKIDRYIDKSICVPDIYTKIFDSSPKNIILISSAIVVSDKPLSYCQKRSVVSAQQRYTATINTILSVRQKIPNSIIILIDPTQIFDDWKIYLKSITDHLIDDSSLTESTDTWLNKGCAECQQILAGLEYITGKYPTATKIFKITGRYYLEKSFKYDNFEDNAVCFMTIPKTSIFFETVPACYTFFYSVPIKYIAEYQNALKNTISKCLDLDKSIETILPYEFGSAFVNHNIEELGVSGIVAPFGSLINS